MNSTNMRQLYGLNLVEVNKKDNNSLTRPGILYILTLRQSYRGDR